MTENTSQLIELKLKTIQYHSGDNLDYLQKNIARDACYTSHNSVAYKRNKSQTPVQTSSQRSVRIAQ